MKIMNNYILEIEDENSIAMQVSQDRQSILIDMTESTKIITLCPDDARELARELLRIAEKIEINSAKGIDN
jgi:hypothetical protein